MQLTVLIEGFVLVLECFLILLLKLDSFCDFLGLEGRLDCSLHLEVRHVVARDTNGTFSERRSRPQEQSLRVVNDQRLLTYRADLARSSFARRNEGAGSTCCFD